MGKKGRHRQRNPKAVARKRFPIGMLAERRRLMNEEFLDQTGILRADKKRLKRLKAKVDKVSSGVSELVEKDSARKRKVLNRKVSATTLVTYNSEKYAIPSAERSRQRRKKETMDVCSDIHGGSKEYKQPILDGLWLTLISEATPERLAIFLKNSRKVMTRVLPKILKESVKSFEDSCENQLRSLKILYGKGLLSKEQYKAVRRNLTMKSSGLGNSNKTSIKFITNVHLPKLLPYNKLIEHVKSVDIGNLGDIKTDFCSGLDDEEKVSGAYRDLESFLLDLASMYIHIDKILGDSSFILHFGDEPYHFRLSIGADGAPFGKDDCATAWLVSFLNIGEHIGSENECFLLAGANCDESHIAMKKYARQLVKDITDIESKLYSVPGCEFKVRFTFELVPSDMKWVATFSGELCNAAHYFSSFGDVNDNNKSTVNGTLGESNNCTWKPWKYADRVEMASKVETKKEELANSSYAKSTKRSKLLTFLRNNKSRQESHPILGRLVDKMYAEPLHNGNNASQHLHSIMLDHVVSKSDIPRGCTNLSELPEDCPFVLYLSTIKEIGASRLHKKVRNWFCQGRKGPMSYRFTGKETKLLCNKFMSVVQAVSCVGDSPLQNLQVCQFAYVWLQLREAISRFNRVTIDDCILQELKISCANYFNACSLLLDSVTPTVWTIGYAIPYHTQLIFDKFGVGLGLNSMQGREAKHVRISQYAKHATLSSRWQLVMRHDYITTVYLRKNDPCSSTYHKCKDVYIPKEVSEPQYCYCGMKKEEHAEKCVFCSSPVYENIKQSAEIGELTPYICNLLSVLS